MSFAEELLAASTDDSLSPTELRALLRLASIRLQKAEIEIQRVYLDIINDLLQPVGQPLLDANAIVKDWLIAHGEISVAQLDVDTETKGNA